MIKISLAILLFAATPSFAQDSNPKSTWASSPVTIDGKAKEWKLPLRLYDSGTKLFFAFANDDKNLYLCFQAPDKMFQTKIMGAGMEISLSDKGKHKVSVIFPLAQRSSSVPPAGNDKEQATDRRNSNTSFVLQNTFMEVKGFATRNGIISINDTSGINAAINFDENNILTYEIAIPYKEWFGPGFSINDLAKEISLEVTINALKQPRHEKGAGANGTVNIGKRRQTNNDRNEENQVLPGEYKYTLYTKVKLKQRFILAKGNDDN